MYFVLHLYVVGSLRILEQLPRWSKTLLFQYQNHSNDANPQKSTNPGTRIPYLGIYRPDPKYKVMQDSGCNGQTNPATAAIGFRHIRKTGGCATVRDGLPIYSLRLSDIC